MEQNQNNQPFQPQPVECNQKNWIKIVLLIFLGIIVLSGTFYAGMLWGTRKKTKELTQGPTIQPTKPPMPSPVTKLAEEIANWGTLPSEDWKTYKDQDLGYSIKYPTSWFLVPGSWKKIGGSWGGSCTYLANKEDKEYGKSLDERKLPVDLTNICSVTICANFLEGKTLSNFVKNWRGTRDLAEVEFNKEEAIYVKPRPRVFTNEGPPTVSEEIWFLGKLEDHVLYMQMGSDPNLLNTCQEYFHTVVKSYQ